MACFGKEPPNRKLCMYIVGNVKNFPQCLKILMITKTFIQNQSNVNIKISVFMPKYNDYINNTSISCRAVQITNALYIKGIIYVGDGKLMPGLT